MQQARGLTVWKTPEILTWEAWLSRQWRSATLQQRNADGRQLLNLSQERLLWETALQQLARSDDPEALRPHAAALMRAASQATQSLLPLSRTAVTEEETLLVAALQQVRELCAARGLVSLNLALPEQLGFLAGCAPPVIVGQPQLTALQQWLQQRYWPGAELLPAPTGESAAAVSLRRTAHLDAEMAACAQWCREQLQQDGRRRLLVVSCWQDPGAAAQGALLWRAFTGSGSASEEQRQALLAVEGGEPLHHQALVGDALAALAMTADWIDTSRLLQLLGSPRFHFGSTSECCALQARLGAWGLARWRSAALLEALASVSAKLPVADRMRGWLEQARTLRYAVPRRSALGWAECFSHCLRAAGFASGGMLDSRDAQRLGRWGELLDEFAGLDAASLPMDADTALQALRRLAQQSVHQGATGDAAITFSTQLHDPVVHYDGIWVMGLTENRWPAPPRPDPYVPLHEQRRCDWPQAGVAQRLRAARWLQQRWRLRTGNLVLSHARQEGDVQHRPAALLSPFDAPWIDADVAAGESLASVAAASRDPALPPMSAAELARPLRGGVERLRVQQECAFHAQAQWRLGAEAPAALTDGIPSRLRGMLLHSLLEGLWGELQDQQRLLALTPAMQAELVARHWSAALRDNAAAGVAWLAPGVLERERLRAARLLDRVLELERGRAPFAVRMREQETTWRNAAASIVMRIDRIDQTAGGYLLVDYKSGAAGSIRLQEGEARPLQLAAYVVALAEEGLGVGGALLLSLKPAQLGYAGASGIDEPLPRGVKPVGDWPAAQQQWQRELQQLLAQHLGGTATLAESLEACRYCHLPAFCRRRAMGDALPSEEGSDE